MNTSIYDASYLNYPHTQQKSRDIGNKIVVGAVVKDKVGELEEEVRGGFSRSMRK